MEEDKPVHGLHKNVAKASAIRAMCQTDGFKVLKDTFGNRIKVVTKKMLDPSLSVEDIMKLRQHVQVWVEIEKVLDMIERTGKVSANALAKMEDFKTSSLKGEQVYGDNK